MANRITVARALAAKHGSKYNRGKGPDIKTDKITINVETPTPFRAPVSGCAVFRGPVYIACANDKDIPDARYWTEGKTVEHHEQQGPGAQEVESRPLALTARGPSRPAVDRR